MNALRAPLAPAPALPRQRGREHAAPGPDHGCEQPFRPGAAGGSREGAVRRFVPPLPLAGEGWGEGAPRQRRIGARA